MIKGAHSTVITKEKGFVNLTGNPGMATAGSGDVLSGIITGLLATGYPPIQAAQLGVYIHGRAGDLRVGETGVEALTASEILLGIGLAFRELSGESPKAKSSENAPSQPEESSDKGDGKSEESSEKGA